MMTYLTFCEYLQLQVPTYILKHAYILKLYKKEEKKKKKSNAIMMKKLVRIFFNVQKRKKGNIFLSQANTF